MPFISPLRLAGAAALLAAAGSAHAVYLVGLTSANELARFDNGFVAGATSVDITGLAANDRFIGIDLRPGDNKIYGITLSNKIYTLDELTGAATFVANLSSSIVSSTLGYGIDFNPVADFTGAASLRLVSSSGNNYAINATTGAVTVATSVGAGYSGVAYSNSNVLPTSAPASTSLYYIDSNNDTLSVATTGFNNPTITVVGSLGVDVLKASGFEIIGSGLALAALNIDAPSLTTSIYRIDLNTGAATVIGTYNGTLTGLTVSAVPEVGSHALMAAGLLAIGAFVRRRA